MIRTRKLTSNATFSQSTARNDSTSVSTFAITTRQLQIAQRVVVGKTAREIATDLSLSRRTVESHIDALRNRLDCVNRCQLTAKLVHLGIEPEE